MSVAEKLIVERDSIRQLVGEFKIMVDKLNMIHELFPKKNLEELQQYIKEWEDVIY